MQGREILHEETVRLHINDNNAPQHLFPLPPPKSQYLPPSRILTTAGCYSKLTVAKMLALPTEQPADRAIFNAKS